MEFKLLGPLEVSANGEKLPLGGIKQRAVLAYLLLQANRVVATSELLEALWGAGEEPRTARRILQNGVWKLRGLLLDGQHSPDEGMGFGPSGRSVQQPMLLTRDPGYVLEVDLDRIDLHTFRKRIDMGRQALAKGDATTASATLREALRLWRGPALADLAEAGIAWPDLVVAQRMKLDAQDDFFEAELACGRHQSILGELEKLLELHPLREMTSAQLMLALYRCGRQVDALNLYERVRRDLVENLGVDPGLKLRRLQQEILNHAPSLLSDVPSGPLVLRAPEATRDPSPHTAAPASPAGRPMYHLLLCAHLKFPDTQPHWTIDTDTHPSADKVRREVQEIVEYYGGQSMSRAALCSTALFGFRTSTDGDATRALMAALALQDRLAGLEDLDLRIAVNQGQVRTGQAPEADCPLHHGTGALLDEAYALLTGSDGTGVRVCGETHRAAMRLFEFRRVDGFTDVWELEGSYDDYLSACAELAEDAHTGPFVDRDHELGVLFHTMERTRRQGIPHLAVVIGQPGAGKTRLLTEFERRAGDAHTSARFISVGQRSAAGSRPGTTLARQLLSAYCGVRPEHSADDARSRLAAACHELRPFTSRGKELYERLSPLLTPAPDNGPCEAVNEHDMVSALQNLLVIAARVKPLVVLVDDADDLDDAGLHLLRSLAEDRFEGPAPLLVVLAAGPQTLTSFTGRADGAKHINWTGVSLPPRRSVCAPVRTDAERMVIRR